MRLDLSFGDAGGGLEEGLPDGLEGGAAPVGAFGGPASQAVEQPAGAQVQEQAELVGLPFVAGGAVRLGVGLDVLDEVLGLAPGAVELVVEVLGAARQVGDDEADVAAPGGDLDAGDDTTPGVPAAGPVSGSRPA